VNPQLRPRGRYRILRSAFHSPVCRVAAIDENCQVWRASLMACRTVPHTGRPPEESTSGWNSGTKVRFRRQRCFAQRTVKMVGPRALESLSAEATSCVR